MGNDFWRTIEQQTFSRRRLLKGAALGGAGLTAAAVIGCGGDDDDDGATTQPGDGGQQTVKRGSINLSGIGSQTLSPNSTAAWPQEFFAIYDQLARVTFDNKMEPGLATKWELDPNNNKRWVFTLRDAQWSDGKPVTAEDVKYTLEYYKNPDNKSALISRVDTVASVDIIDNRTVAVNTTVTDGIFHKKVFFLHILPKHIMSDPTKGDNEIGNKPIGSGAYIVEEYSRGATLRLKANPNSWRGTKGIDSIKQTVVPDAQTALAAYEVGDLDVVSVSGQDVERVSGFKGTTIFKTPADGYHGYSIEGQDPPYNDVRVRLALAHAIDQELISKTVYFGINQPSPGQPLPAPVLGHNPNIPRYKYDPDMARRLLREAGLDKFSTKMEFGGNSPQNKSQSEAIADFWKDIGVTTELIPVDTAVFREGFYGRRKRSPFLYLPTNATILLEGSVCIQWNVSTLPNKWQFNTKFDEAYYAAIAEPDDKKREQLYWKAEQILHDDASSLWIVDTPGTSAFRSDRIKAGSFFTTNPLYYDSALLV